ncbi:SAM-dependent methyltransferase [Virgibacillus sp. 7505]|uniref:methyltransferase domain-containing protein n=1 Tax=Virgibacillus sp. 7505 TaxID=2022548 RepID=UPI000BA50F57|nr:methyltransferase domain-containing protein [Virgibacillus sp. 7505]PAE17226.1 SAM-dependent methyltransferase [Virgibacillus sp. 7505]
MGLFNLLLEDSVKAFTGWDFSYVEDTGRVQYEPLPWSYGSKARKYLFGAGSALDMGTGGGEFLSKLLPLPEYTVATESYLPNVPIARNRLSPLGVDVVQIKEDDQLPFLDESFEVILNKHESYDVSEVWRVVKQNAIFLTQQVGGTDSKELNQLLGAPLNPDFENWSRQTAVEELEDRFTILESAEAFPSMRFYDIGAVIYYLKAIPWQVPQFTVDAYRDALFEMHLFIEKNGYLNVRQHRFLLAARSK